MIKALTDTVNYFQAPKNYFWQWADLGNCIEWQKGTTICYRHELILILKELTIPNAPPLSAILLLLAACQDNFDETKALEILTWVLSTTENTSEDSSDEVLEYHINQAVKLMHNIAQLPKELRRRQRSMYLINEILQPNNISQINLQDVVDEFNSGLLDKFIFVKQDRITNNRFKIDLQFLSDALIKFPTTESLELRLQTGVDKIPKPADIIVPESSSLDLLDQLSEDPTTVGIARLAKRLIAAFKIPMHSTSSGGQSYGGISDITNRGNYDKLLLSELAHDDLLLMARLVNNEALYFRREEPPNNPKKHRAILIDTTIKMWGVPRVFALSAALACVFNNKHGELVEAYALGGSTYKEINLDTKKGIIQSLTLLNHSLDCGIALESIIKDMPVSEQYEHIFITDENLLNTPSFHASLLNIRDSLSFILTVNRNGQLNFYECIKGRTKLLSKGKFDLEELLFSNPVANKKTSTNINLPGFITTKCKMLFFPCVGMKLDHFNVFHHHTLGLIAITDTQRVLYWPKKSSGAIEIIDFIEKGKAFFGYDGVGTLSLMIKNNENKFESLRTIVFNNWELVNCAIKTEKNEEEELKYENGYFYIKSSGIPLTRPDFSFIKKIINNGYSVLLRVDRIYINSTNELSFSRNKLAIKNNCIKIEKYEYESVKKSTIAVKQEDQLTLPENPNIKLQKWIWADGSEAIIDNRGLLHLKSADISITEITIVLVLGKGIACIALDGKACGSNYFINSEKATIIPEVIFYNKYIQPFIDRIYNYEITTTI